MFSVKYADCHWCWVSHLRPLCWLSLCWLSLYLLLLCWLSLCWVSQCPLKLLEIKNVRPSISKNFFHPGHLGQNKLVGFQKYARDKRSSLFRVSPVKTKKWFMINTISSLHYQQCYTARGVIYDHNVVTML
jgi:hypothetical protein